MWPFAKSAITLATHLGKLAAFNEAFQKDRADWQGDQGLRSRSSRAEPPQCAAGRVTQISHSSAAVTSQFATKAALK
jgi:hypothetical protein